MTDTNKNEVEQLRQLVADMTEERDELMERYNAAQAEVSEVRAKWAATRELLAYQDTQVDELRMQIALLQRALAQEVVSRPAPAT